VRLLEILPSRDTSVVHCTLTHDDLVGSADVPYYAISYVWGPPEPSSVINVNGKIFKVRQNLFNFLLSMSKRNLNGNKRLWIDAVCINQDDIAESNQQAQQMAFVYSNAKTVYMWLGLSDVSSDTVLDLFKVLRQKSMRSQFQPDLFHNFQPDSTFRGAMGRFLSKVYWTRLWVIQEVYLAKEVRVICGEKDMSFIDLQAFCKWGELILSLNYLPGFVLCLNSLAPEGLYLDALLIRNLLCEDLRDKSYGLLSVVKDAEDFPVDYSIGLPELYFKAVNHFIGLNTMRATVRLVGELGLTTKDISDYVASSDGKTKDQGIISISVDVVFHCIRHTSLGSVPQQTEGGKVVEFRWKDPPFVGNRSITPISCPMSSKLVRTFGDRTSHSKVYLVLQETKKGTILTESSRGADWGFEYFALAHRELVGVAEGVNSTLRTWSRVRYSLYEEPIFQNFKVMGWKESAYEIDKY
jgi:hypothetical protein